jgi:hypothetical protein
MALPHNSTLINEDDIESITSELSRLSPIFNSSLSNSEYEPNMNKDRLNRRFGMHRYNSDDEQRRREMGRRDERETEEEDMDDDELYEVRTKP